ncbi:MAG: ABC transporter permease [Dehalococcoidales bacterium]
MKKWLGVLSTVWVGISTHKLRSILTMLGIVIGVAAVIALMSIGKGTTANILANISRMGANLITISPGATTTGGVRSAGGATRTLTMQDAQAIQEQVSNISGISPVYTSNLQLIVGAQNVNAQVSGVNPQYFQISNLNLADGNLFSDDDYNQSAMYAVIGSNVATTLFPNIEPVGQQMRMGNVIVRVIGVLVSQGAGFGSPDDAVYMPLTTMQQMVSQPARTAQGGNQVSSINLDVTDSKYTQQVIADITSLLRTRHQLSASADSDFRIQSMEQIASTLTQTTGQLTLLLGAVAAISLLVGGIGVMNIMLVSVLERTREIGIRKALGARERDIWIQFLVEAALLCFAGGIIGVVVGLGVSTALDYLKIYTTVITPDIIIMAVSVSVGIGLFFGFYPAWNASRLNPIEALRSE